MNFVSLTACGYWFCARCHAPVELLQADDGVAVPRCGSCRSHRVSFMEPVAPAAQRLPGSKRNLSLLALQGFWFCTGCQQISENHDGRCMLCGRDCLAWNAPVFPAEAADPGPAAAGAVAGDLGVFVPGGVE